MKRRYSEATEESVTRTPRHPVLPLGDAHYSLLGGVGALQTRKPKLREEKSLTPRGRVGAGALEPLRWPLAVLALPSTASEVLLRARGLPPLLTITI